MVGFFLGFLFSRQGAKDLVNRELAKEKEREQARERRAERKAKRQAASGPQGVAAASGDEDE